MKFPSIQLSTISVTTKHELSASKSVNQLKVRLRADTVRKIEKEGIRLLKVSSLCQIEKVTKDERTMSILQSKYKGSKQISCVDPIVKPMFSLQVFEFVDSVKSKLYTFERPLQLTDFDLIVSEIPELNSKIFPKLFSLLFLENSYVCKKPPVVHQLTLVQQIITDRILNPQGTNRRFSLYPIMSSL